MEKDIKIVNICDLLEILYPNYWSLGLYKSISYQESSKRILHWCIINNYTYYGAPKERFSESEAQKLAFEGNYEGVVVENMS